MCDVFPMSARNILLGRQWLFDHLVKHSAKAYSYKFEHRGCRFTHEPLSMDCKHPSMQKLTHSICFSSFWWDVLVVQGSPIITKVAWNFLLARLWVECEFLYGFFFPLACMRFGILTHPIVCFNMSPTFISFTTECLTLLKQLIPSETTAINLQIYRTLTTDITVCI